MKRERKFQSISRAESNRKNYLRRHNRYPQLEVYDVETALEKALGGIQNVSR